jgi:hypothetical protein
MPVTRSRCNGGVSRRPRGTCPVCRNTLSLRWSGEIKVLRKHNDPEGSCAGSDRPALGEVPELHLTRPAAPEQRGDAEERFSSVA